MDSTNNIYLQKIAGEYSGDLPEPHSANGELLKRIAEQGGVVTDDHINELIDAKLGVISNGTY